MKATKESQSTYAGFLNGYIAGNLSGNSLQLAFHSDKIGSFLQNLKIEVDRWGLDSPDLKKIEGHIKKASNIQSHNENTIASYIKLGDAIYDLISSILNCKPQLPSETSFILKKIVYHFLNIAKTSKNSNVTKQAKRIAGKFKS